MTLTLTRRMILAAGLAAWAAPGHARQTAYALVAENSTISFRFTVNGVTQSGTVPVESADIRIDLDNLAASSADVTADIRRARTGLIFVTQALLSESVLDAGNHPIVHFESTRIRLGAKGRISEGARIDGRLTLRGTTRDISLDALLSRAPGTAPDDLSVLFVQLRGALNRRDFGVTGYPGLVDDTVILDIRAELRAVA